MFIENISDLEIILSKMIGKRQFFPKILIPTFSRSFADWGGVNPPPPSRFALRTCPQKVGFCTPSLSEIYCHKSGNTIHKGFSLLNPQLSIIELVGKPIYTITLCVCVRAYSRVQLPRRLILKPYLLSKRRHCRVERTTKEPASGVLRT